MIILSAHGNLVERVERRRASEHLEEERAKGPVVHAEAVPTPQQDL